MRNLLQIWSDRMNDTYIQLDQKKLNVNEAFAKISAAGKIASFASIELKNKIRTGDTTQLSFLENFKE